MAVQLDEILAEAHLALATVRALWEWNWDESLRELDQVLESNPNNATAYRFLGIYWWAMGDPAKAVRSIQKAQELEPLSAQFSLYLEWGYFFNHQYDDAIAQHKITQQLSLGLIYMDDALGRSLSGKGLYDEAIRAFDEARGFWGIRLLGRGLCLSG